MVSNIDKINEYKKNLRKIQAKIRELKILRKKSGLNSFQEKVFLDLNEAQKLIFEKIKKLYDLKYNG